MPEVYESFNKPDSDILGPNHAWTKAAADSQLISVVSNQLGGSAGATATARARPDVTLDSGDQQAELTVNVLKTHTVGSGNTSAGPLVRLTTTGTTFSDHYGLEIHNLDKYFFYKVVSGTVTRFRDGTALPTGSLVAPLPGVARIDVQGSTVRAHWKGTLLATVTDTALPAGSTRQAAGVVIFQPASVTLVDDFRAGVLPKASLVLTGAVAVTGQLSRGLKHLRTASAAAVGALNLMRVVTRSLAGAAAPAGALSRGALARLLAASATPAGLLLRTARLAEDGAVRPTAGPVRKLLRAVRQAVVAPVGTAIATNLGRTFGQPGEAVMTVRAAGEARLRVRRGTEQKGGRVTGRHVQGQPLIVDVDFRVLGVTREPVIVRCVIRKPSGLTTELTYPSANLIRTDLGQYAAHVVADEPGTWGFRFVAAGNVEAVNEIPAEVVRSIVLS